MINAASILYDKFLNIYVTQYDNLPENQKKNINVLNNPKNLFLDFVEDLPLEGDGKVKLETEETIAARVKLNPRKREKHEQD